MGLESYSWVKRPGSGERVSRERDAGDLLVDERPELAIISPTLWQAVRARREQVANRQRKGQRHKTRRVYPLSGILRCGKCDSTLIIYGGSRSAKAYRCGDNRKRGTCDNALSVREDVARRAILAELRLHLARPAALAYLRERAAEILSVANNRTDVQLGRARRELEATQTKVRRLVRSLEDGMATSAVTRRIVELEALEMTQRRRVSDLRNSARASCTALPTVEELVARAAEIGRLVEADPAAARERLRDIFCGRIVCVPTDQGYIARTTISPGVLFAEKADWHPKTECQSSECSGGRI